MSNIKSFKKEKEKRERKQRGISAADNYEENPSEKIRKHRFSKFYRVLVVTAFIFTIFLVSYLQYKNKVYTQMNCISSFNRNEIQATEDISLADKIVTYGKDGISCADAKGNALWNQTYEMQHPMISTCRSVVAVADYQGRKIYIMDEEQKLGEVTTNLPVRSLCVAANGVVLTVQEDAKVSWIYMYDSKGTELACFHTMMSDTGYPIAVGMSPDAKIVGVSYTYLEDASLQTRVAFYNFDEVGNNQIDHLVSGYNYADSIVPYIEFMKEDVALAVGDNRMMLYSGKEVPEARAERILDDEVQAVYHNSQYAGLIFRNNSAESSCILQVYNNEGEEVLQLPLNIQNVADVRILLEEKEIIVYNEQKCAIYNYNGKRKFEGTFPKSVHLMIPLKNSQKYVLVSSDTIDTVELN